MRDENKCEGEGEWEGCVGEWGMRIRASVKVSGRVRDEDQGKSKSKAVVHTCPSRCGQPTWHHCTEGMR